MLVDSIHYRSIWYDSAGTESVKVIDQRKLPFFFEILELRRTTDFYSAIKDMIVRGAPLIGVTAAFGVYFASLETVHQKNFTAELIKQAEMLKTARPTAVNLSWAVDRQIEIVRTCKNSSEIPEALLRNAQIMADDDVEVNKKIGEHGFSIIKDLFVTNSGKQINILTHCNAGWLATVDYGTALAPIFKAKREGIDVHVWVDETRPRNQGANLTAWELFNEKIPFTVIADNTGGHLMQKGMVDIVIVGTDRTTISGTVYNKIGTYLKALPAKDNAVPFYVAAPSSSIDFDDNADVPIEQRSSDEVRKITGMHDNRIIDISIMPDSYPAANYAFDATAPELVTGLITERGICKPNRTDILNLFPEKIGKH